MFAATARARRPATEIVALLRDHADHPLSPPLYGPRDPLASWCMAALLITVCGRTALIDELTGPGVSALRDRLTSR